VITILAASDEFRDFIASRFPWLAVYIPLLVAAYTALRNALDPNVKTSEELDPIVLSPQSSPGAAPFVGVGIRICRSRVTEWEWASPSAAVRYRWGATSSNRPSCG